MKRSIISVLFFLFATLAVFSQTVIDASVDDDVIVVEKPDTVDQQELKKSCSKFNHWSLAISGGMSFLDGDQSQEAHHLFPYSSVLGAGSLSLAFDFNPRVGLFAQYSYLPTKVASTYYPYEQGVAGSQVIEAKTYIHNVSLNVAVNLATLLGKCYDNPKWAIYMNMGVGVSFYNISVFNKSTDSHDYGLSYTGGYAGFLPVGFTVEYSPLRWLGIFWDNQYSYYFEDDLDSSVKGNSDDGTFYSGLGVRFKFSTNGHCHMRNISWCQYADKNNNLSDEIENLKKRADNTDKEIAAIKDDVEKLKNKKPEPPAPTLTEADVERMISKEKPSSSCCGPSPVYFNVNSAKFSEQAQLAIAQLAQKMYEDNNLSLEIIGYCDYTGSESYNEKLSLDRAERVKKELINTYGIDSNRISCKGKGRTKGPKENYLPNRRCEFVFSSK